MSEQATARRGKKATMTQKMWRLGTVLALAAGSLFAVATHGAALEYVDGKIGRLFGLLRRPSFVIVCSDHGTAYGEDGHTGHRIGHETVWTVPYGEFVLS